MAKNSKTEKMQFFGLLLNQLLSNQEMQQALNNYGVTKERLLELKEMHEETNSMFDLQIKEYGDQLKATQTYKELWQKASQNYVNSLKIARLVFRDYLDACQVLQLNGERKTNLLDWYAQAKTFYNGLLNSAQLLKQMEIYNYSSDRLKEELVQVEQVYEAYMVQKTETSEAVLATERRDQKFDEFYQKGMDLKTVVKIAFTGRTDWLKATGV